MLHIASSKMASNSTNGKSARAAILVFFVRIISAFLAFILQVFLARWMGSEQYGIFVLVWVVIVMLGAISCLGLQTAVIRFITEYKAKNDFKRLNGILLAAPGIAVLVSVTAAVLMFIILFLFADKITANYVLPLYLALVCLPFLTLEEIQEGIARSFDMPLTAIGPAFIIRPAGILITMAFAYLLGFPANAATALSSAVIATFIATIIQSLMLWLRISKLHKAKFPVLKLINLLGDSQIDIKFQFRYWISVSLPIFLASGFYGFLFNSDVVLIGLMLGPDAVAFYYAALKSLALVHFVHFAFRAASAHHFSRFYSDNNIQGLSDYANKIARWTFWPTLAIAVIMILTGKYILMLFGAGFAEAQNLLIILALGIVLRASIGPIDALLAMTGQQSVAMWVLAITLLSNIILNVSLIPHYGILGAAIATSCAMFIETAFLYIAVSRKLGISVFVFHFSGKTIDEGYAT
jgi:O-antigen/teichoic acid export membrane protein